MSSSPQTIGVEYSGSLAQVIGFGPVDILHKIENGETVIWEGPIVRQESADIDGKSDLETTIGTIKFYWGTATQNPDPVLQGLIIDQGNGPFTAPMPAFRNLCYAVLDRVKFGGQTTPPTLVYTVSKFPSVFTLDGRVTRVHVTAPGSGYTTAPVISFTGGGGSGAAATARVKRGRVIGIDVTDPGAGYTSTPSVVIGGPGTGATATAYRYHELNGDCILPECLYEFLTNELYGPGIDAADLNTDDFETAANTIIEEDLGVSPNLDDTLSLREFIGKCVNYLDAMPIRKDGQISLLLVRPEDTSGALVLDESDYLDEPQPRNRGLEATANFTRVTFTERENQWEEGVEPYDHPANAEAQGQSVEKTSSYPWITRRSVAKFVAKRVGLKSALPPFFFDLNLKPSHKGIQPGDIVKVNSAKLGLVDRISRVVDVRRNRPDEPGVFITVMAEQTRDTTHDYVPPQDFFRTPGTTDDEGGDDFDITSATPRIAVLPEDLKNNKRDGFLCVFGRTSGLIRKAEIWFWTGTPIGSYQKMLTVDSYPIFAHVLGVHQVSTDTFIVRMLFDDTSPDAEDFATYFQEANDIYAVTGQRRVRTIGTASDEHKVMPIWLKKVQDGYFAAISDTIFEAEFTSGEFGAGDVVVETLAAAGTIPTDAIYIGRLEEFPIVRSDHLNFDTYGGNYFPRNPYPGDTDQIRYVKVLLANTRLKQTLNDVDPVTYDRDDFTMQGGVAPSPITNPGGTYDPDWGDRSLATSELADLVLGQYFLLTTASAYTYGEDIDDVLGTIYDETVEDANGYTYPPIDDALGLISEKRNLLYTYNP